MREYDTTLIVQPEISEEGREALIAKLGGVLERAGAMPLEVDDLGKKKLSYEIQNFQKGHYLALYFLDEGNAVTELERSMRLDESVLRFLTVRKKEDVIDVETRKARAVEAERIRRERAAERAEREAEERAAREAARVEAEAEAAARAQSEAAQAAAAAETATDGDNAPAADSETSAAPETTNEAPETSDEAPETTNEAPAAPETASAAPEPSPPAAEKTEPTPPETA